MISVTSCESFSGTIPIESPHWYSMPSAAISIWNVSLLEPRSFKLTVCNIFTCILLLPFWQGCTNSSNRSKSSGVSKFFIISIEPFVCIFIINPHHIFCIEGRWLPPACLTGHPHLRLFCKNMRGITQCQHSCILIYPTLKPLWMNKSRVVWLLLAVHLLRY